ncbi:MAG: hypothetical protein LCH96_13045 [Actinobacteria bacterium]|nr:hypothetical protein [Actinomycetota bacterium]
MGMSAGTTAWVVSGAIGVVAFTGGMIASQGTAVPAAPKPAVTVSPGPSAGPTVTPSNSTRPTTSATARPTTDDDSPSPVSPPSAETPDD